MNLTKRQVEIHLAAGLSAQHAYTEEFFEHAKQFYPKTCQAYLDWQNTSNTSLKKNALATLRDAMASENIETF